MQETIVIIGSSIAGLSAAEAARQQSPQSRILILSEDRYPPYFRQRLAEILTDRDRAEKLYLHEGKWYEDRNLELLLNHKVTGINTDTKTVLIENGDELPYDKLILASGSASFVPPMPGAHLNGVTTLWSMQDALDIEERLKTAKRGIVIGGGLLGLEAANAMHARGLQTLILERLPRLMMKQLDTRSSELFLEQVKSEGTQVTTQAYVKEIYGDADGKVLGVRLEDGRDLTCELVIISAGVTARTEYLKDTGIALDRKIIVDNRMRTNVPDVYACGDSAVMDGRWYGLWMIAKQQGQTAGTNAAGGEAQLNMPVPPYMVKTMGTQLVSSGVIEESELSKEQLDQLHADISENSELFQYSKKLYTGNRLSGFVLLGDTKAFNSLSREMRTWEDEEPAN